MENPPAPLPQIRECVAKCKAEIGLDAKPGATPPRLVQIFWEVATKKRPVPSETECNRLATLIDFRNVRMPSNKQNQARPIRSAIETLFDAYPEARHAWAKQSAAGVRVAEAKNSMEYLDSVFAAIQNADLLASMLGEHKITIANKGFETIAKDLRPEVERLWSEAGFSVGEPHAGSPVIRFLSLACGYLGHEASPHAITSCLRK